jgi:hypothetical protein
LPWIAEQIRLIAKLPVHIQLMITVSPPFVNHMVTTVKNVQARTKKYLTEPDEGDIIMTI